jgi:uncharacterized protein YdaU (DUF1376 family)
MSLKPVLLVSLLLGLFFSVPEYAMAQKASRQVRQVQKRQEKQEKAEKKDFEKERARQYQEHISRQTPEVQARMKQNKKDSRKWGRHKTPFYKKWLRKIRN